MDFDRMEHMALEKVGPTTYKCLSSFSCDRCPKTAGVVRGILYECGWVVLKANDHNVSIDWMSSRKGWKRMPDAGVPINALIKPYKVVYPWLIEFLFITVQ